MKRLLLILGLCLMAFAVRGATWTDDNSITWRYTVIDGEAWLGLYTSSSETYLAIASPSGAIEIPSTVGSAAYPVVGLEPLAFYYCTSITSVTFPESVREIGAYAFCGCTSITSMTFSEGLEKIGDYAFANVACTSISLPSTVGSIGAGAFYGCTAMTTLTLQEGLTSIGSLAFYYCSRLTSLSLPSTVSRIGDNAFKQCLSLTSVTLPSLLESVPDCAFLSCSALTSVSFPSDLVSIGASAFSGCSRLSSLSLPSNLVSIGDSAFYGCTQIGSVTLPDTLTTIGASAFYGCSRLSTSTFPSALTTIGDSAFYSCTTLSSITLPASLASLGTNAFYNCTSLTSVTFQGEPPATYGSSIFYAGTSSSSGPGGNMGPGSGGFPGSSSSTTKTQYGYYSPSYASAWTAVISSNKWDNLTMSTNSQYLLDVTIVGDGSVDGTGLYTSGTSVTLTASPTLSSTFYGWQDEDGNLTSQDTTLTVTKTAATQTYTAIFVPTEALLSLQSAVDNAITYEEAKALLLEADSTSPVFIVDNDTLTITFTPQTKASLSDDWSTLTADGASVTTSEGSVLLTLPRESTDTGAFYQFTVPDE